MRIITLKIYYLFFIPNGYKCEVLEPVFKFIFTLSLYCVCGPSALYLI